MKRFPGAVALGCLAAIAAAGRLLIGHSIFPGFIYKFIIAHGTPFVWFFNALRYHTEAPWTTIFGNMYR